MEEIAPGIHHWSAVHPRLGFPVHSHYVESLGLVIDPMVPEDGLDVFAGLDVGRIVLTSGVHYRDADAFRDAFGCELLAPKAGTHRFAPDQLATTYEAGEEVAPGVFAIEVGVLCPDEMALHFTRGNGFLFVADGVVRSPEGGGPLTFPPDFALGDDPEALKAGLRARFAEIVEEIAFEGLLLAHGDPVLTGARDELRAFAMRT